MLLVLTFRQGYICIVFRDQIVPLLPGPRRERHQLHGAGHGAQQLLNKPNECFSLQPRLYLHFIGTRCHCYFIKIITCQCPWTKLGCFSAFPLTALGSSMRLSGKKVSSFLFTFQLKKKIVLLFYFFISFTSFWS